MDDKLDIFGLSVPPGCGKSTLEDFFLSLVGGWFPNDFNLSSAHSSILTRSLYDGVLEIINDPVEYTWHEIFPNVKLTGTNAKETTVNLERNGRFKTWTFRSIEMCIRDSTGDYEEDMKKADWSINKMIELRKSIFDSREVW